MTLPATSGLSSPRDREILQGLARRIDPADAGAHNNLGVLYYNKGMVVEAVDALHRALDIEPGMQVALRNLEIAYLATGHYGEVVASLTARLRERPADAEARWRLARAHRHTGHLAEAASELRRLLADAPSELRYLLELGRVEREAGRFDRAFEAYERAARIDPKSAVLNLHLGELHYHHGNTEQALAALRTAVTLEPRLGEAWHLLAFVHGDLGDEERAHEALEHAQRLRPELVDDASGLSIDRNSPVRYSELVGERHARPGTVPDRYLGHFNLGSAFRQQGLYEQALREFERSVEAGEDVALARQATAEVLLLAGRDHEAEGVYRALLNDDPESPKLWNELGVAAHRQGDVREAERCYTTALELHDGYALALNNLGVARADSGEARGAVEAFERAAAAGSFPEPLCNLGLLADREGDPRGALERYRSAVERAPESAAGWTGVGAVLGEAGRLDEARQALARAVELSPESAEARYRLAFVLNRMGEVEGALRETRRALALDPYFTAARYRLAIELQFEHAAVPAPALTAESRVGGGARVAEFRPEPEEVSAIFARLRGPAAPAPPPDAGGAEGYALAEDYLSKGMLAKAVGEARRVVLSGGDPVEAALLTGEVFRRQRLEGEALERFETALTRLEGVRWSEQHARGWLGRGWSLLALGRPDGAAEAAGVVQARDPAALEPRRLHAEALLRMGRAEEACDRFARLADASRGDATLLMRLGEAARLAGRSDRARDAYERALRTDPDLLAARVELGRLLLAEGSHGAAAGHARAALDALPGYAEAALLLADAEHAIGRSREAVAVLVDLLAEDVYHLAALQRLGEILLESGAAGDAATAFRRVLRFDRTAADAWLGLAGALEAAGERAEAEECRRRGREAAVASPVLGPAPAAVGVAAGGGREGEGV